MDKIKTKDLKSGMKFNKLTAIAFEKKTKTQIYWLFECDCEQKTIKSFRSPEVIAGTKKSCGCTRGESQKKRFETVTSKMIGMKFEFLTVISHQSREKGYVCLCQCGNTTVAKTDALKKGRHNSCGCKPRKTKGNNDAAKHAHYKNYKSAAKRRGYDFSLDKIEFIELVESNCFYCGEPPSMASYLKRHELIKFNGVDRVDNTIGYIKSNCVPCCDICNNSKSTLALSNWLAWVDKIYKFQKDKK